jgi:hypothetical protein
MGNCVCSAPVHLHVDNEVFILILAAEIIQADEPAAQHSHAHAHNLSWAEMTMRNG